MRKTAGPPQFHFELDSSQCIACAICADVCAKNALTFAFQATLPKWHTGICNGCMECVQQCPSEAIQIRKER